ncbi:MAG: 23S rRNA (uracil(1939)-C(5))-methyltransferase RlmD [Gammaproteobacteria bacterium]|nr:23S rRNA (uracil(1939)-C(5))-methyltransferase RlmD [Gammaproteobacteria bacterium]
MDGRHAKKQPGIEALAEVVALTDDGRGLGRWLDGKHAGKVVMLDDALPGERVLARLRRRKRRTDEATVLQLETRAADRVAPRCRHFGVCGGCALQHLAPAAQVAYKQRWVLDALQRIGGVQPQQMAPPLTGPVWSYRRRARLGVKLVLRKGGVIVGFRQRHSPLLAQLSRCEVLDARVGMRLAALAEMLGRLSIADSVPQIEVACAEHVALVVRVLRMPDAADRQLLAEFAADTGFELYLQPGGPDSVSPLHPPARALRYSPDAGELRLEFRPTDFVQINPEISQAMVRQVLDWLAPAPGAAVLELFCGLGHFSLPLAAAGCRVTAIEGDVRLVDRARANAASNRLPLEAVWADLLQPSAQAPWLARDYSALLLDPPRTGAQDVLRLLLPRAPARVLYVSCHPGTLARDAGLLVREGGYRLRRVGVLDMFPHTAHVETMALFERED